MIDVEKATEEFRQRLESGYFDEDFPLSGKEIDDLLKALQNGTITKHQSDDDPKITRESAIDFLQKDGWLVEHDRILTESNGHCEFTNLPPYEYQSEINPDDTYGARLKEEYVRGYENGYNEAKTEFYENRYQEGLQDAWELAQKIVAMNNRELDDCKFEVNIKYPDHINAVNIIADNSVNEVLEKIKAYEQRIEVGDEVYFADSNHKRVVTAIIDGVAVQFTETGKWVIDVVDKLHKTGKHYDIQSILDGLKERANEQSEICNHR